jgi:hypothetical protein
MEKEIKKIEKLKIVLELLQTKETKWNTKNSIKKIQMKT